MFELVDTPELDAQANLQAIGVGGGGGNTIAQMLRQGHADSSLSFVMANTDRQALRDVGPHALVLGENLTQGLGAGARPEIGQQAAEESEAAIRERLRGTDMLFLTAGMGGGTGTGAAPVIARIARDMGVLTIAIVTRPFSFEGGKRKRLAEEGIKALAGEVDSLITIPNDKLMAVMGKNASLLTAFDAVNDVLRDAVLGIADMITSPGMINVDFADVRTVMSNQGMAKIGTGRAVGEARAEQAALDAINSPLLDDVDVSGAAGLLVNITAGPELSIGEFNTIGETLQGFVGDDATVVIGTSLDMERSEEIQVTVVATGLAPATAPVQAPPAARHVAPVTAQQNAVADVAQRRDECPAWLAEPSRSARQQAQRTQPDSDSFRQGATPSVSRTRQPSSTQASERTDEAYLDIPAFLRRPLAGR